MANSSLVLPAILPVPLTRLLPALLGAAPSPVPAAAAAAGFCSAGRGAGRARTPPGTARPRRDKRHLQPRSPLRGWRRRLAPEMLLPGEIRKVFPIAPVPAAAQPIAEGKNRRWKLLVLTLRRCERCCPEVSAGFAPT